MRVTGDDSRSKSRCRNRKIDDSSKSINHKALETLAMAAPNTKLTSCSFSYYRREGTTSLPRRRRGTTDARDSFARQPKPTGEAQLVPFHTTTTTPKSSQPEGPTTSLQSATDDNGTPATWTLVLFQQAIDRQDRTQTEGRFSLLEPLEIQPVPQEYSHYRTRTHRSCDDMPCRTTLH